MRRLVVGVLAAGACVMLSGCPSKTVQEGGQSVGKVGSQQCVEDRRNLEASVEAYTLLEGGVPASEAAMVPSYLRLESTLHDIDALGNVIPVLGSGCS